MTQYNTITYHILYNVANRPMRYTCCDRVKQCDAAANCNDLVAHRDNAAAHGDSETQPRLQTGGNA